MKPLCCLLLSVMLLLVPNVYGAEAGIVVIVHPDNPVNSLSRNQVIDIFMGRFTCFPNGSIALPIDQAPDCQTRNDYYRLLVGKSVSQVNAYWARLLFTGRATPPRPLDSAVKVLEAVSNNRDAIAYINEQDSTASVKIVYRLEEAP